MLRVRTLTVLAAAFLLSPLFAVTQAPAPDDQKSLHEFLKQANDYLQMEHQLPAGKIKPAADAHELHQQRIAIRQALVEARANAHQGDLFTPDVGTAFRHRLAATLSGPYGPKIKASLAHAEPGAPSSLAVNHVYPDPSGQPLQSIPPTLLQNLPTLPKGLAYIIAGKTLALRDTEAGIIVDFLPNALP